MFYALILTPSANKNKSIVFDYCNIKQGCFLLCESGIIKSIDCGTKVKNMIKEVINDPILLAMKSEKRSIIYETLEADEPVEENFTLVSVSYL